MNPEIVKLKPIFSKIYGKEIKVLQLQLERYSNLAELYSEKFGKQDVHFFSTPGRTEIGGNHTDHNHGRVLAGSVSLDSIAVAAKNQSECITVYSRGYEEPFRVGLDKLDVDVKEEGTTTSLIRGIAFRLKKMGYRIGGFDACMESDVLPGSGLSSSASVEVLIGTIFNAFFNDNSIPPETIAIIGQYAENNYFGKPLRADETRWRVPWEGSLPLISRIHRNR